MRDSSKFGESLKDTDQLIRDAEKSESTGLLSGPWFGTRHTLILWGFLGFTTLFIQRVNMNIALVAMAQQNASGAFQDNGSTEFTWSNTLQGIVLSAFYYGYFTTQIPGGMLARVLGGKPLFAGSVIGCSALSLLTPLAARLDVGFLIGVRVVQGLLQGLVFPSMQVILSKWVPATERSRLVAFTYAGCQAGTVFGMLSAGYLCDVPQLGWPSVFYIGGGIGMLWAFGWLVCTHESPSRHPRITDDERRYIELSVDRPKDEELRTPWRSIFTSPALYAIAAAHFANDWGCFAVMTCLPKFMKDILRFDMSKNGFLSSMPYLVVWTFNLVAGSLADFLRKPNRLRTVYVRKLMVFIGLIGPGTLLLAAAYLPGCGRAPVVVLLTAAMGLSGFTMAGHSVNHLDIAPAFAGILFALTNSFGTTSGFIGPALAGVLTEGHDTRERWEKFFLISGAVYAVGGTIYVLFARGDIQPWAKVKSTDSEVIVPPPPQYGSIQRTPSSTEDGSKETNDDVR
ncbi:hypothetical protein BaRGS_00019342 [Batillaria attramentaria]|uniref:Major facilitator superfamily (MFS) profile domain-containing protein n=1 Tax=Batillaria attramentaria TaxID=370345 RepID=A0ABD0KQ73_9CAEN